MCVMANPLQGVGWRSKKLIRGCFWRTTSDGYQLVYERGIKNRIEGVSLFWLPPVMTRSLLPQIKHNITDAPFVRGTFSFVSANNPQNLKPWSLLHLSSVI